MALDPILAQALKDKNMISDEAYQKFVPSPVMTNEAGAEAAASLPEFVASSVKQPMPIDQLPGNKFLADNLSAPTGVRVPAEIAARDKAVIASQAVAADPAIATEEIATGAMPAAEVKPRSSNGQSMPSGYATAMGGYDQQKAGNDAATKAGIDEANAQAAFQQQTYDNAEKMRVTEETKALERQKTLDDKMAKVNELQAAYASKPATVGDKFAEASTGQKIQMAIGLFLGAAPNSTGQNKALATLQAAIDSDLAKSKTEITNASNIYKEMQETFKDRTQAEAAARITYLNNAQIKANQILSQYKSPQLAAAGQMLKGKIDVEKGAAMANFAKAVNNQFDMSGADEITTRIMKLPDNLRNQALKEKADLDLIDAQSSRLDTVFKDLEELQTVKNRIGSPIQSSSLLEKAESDLFPIVKAISGERMTDSDARILIKSNLPKLLDAKETVNIKRDSLKNALMAKRSGSTPILSGLGILPKTAGQKYKTLKPLK